MAEIFGLEAQKYWDKGLPVIPLRMTTKIPIPKAWQTYGHSMPSYQEQQDWLNSYRNHNIGLPLGKQSGIVIIDIDTTNLEIMEAITKILPPSPWFRKGKKGAAIAYKYRGEAIKRISTEEEGMIVELLSQGSQIVLPPSIHPETLLPYTSNCNLYDVIDELQFLPADIIERMSSAISQFVKLKSVSEKSKFRISDFVPLGARDVSMTQMVGKEARGVMLGEVTVKRSIGNIISWVEMNTAKNATGDNLDSRKGIQKFVEFLITDIMRGNKMLPPGWDDELTPDEILAYGLDVINEDHKELTYSQITEKIHDSFKDLETTDSIGRMTVVSSILQKMSKCSRLNNVEIKEILTTMKNFSKLNLTVADMKRELERLKKGPIEGTNHTEIANAVFEHYSERVSELRYHNDRFWDWNGMHWAEVNVSVLNQITSLEFGDLMAAKKSSDHNGIISVLKHNVSKPLAAVEVEGVNFKNGFLNREMKLVPHQPEHGKTYVLDFCYYPEKAGNCPRFLNHLHECWGDEPDYQERLVSLQEAISTTLFGITSPFQKVFLLYGQPSSGKSVIMEAIQHIIPESAQSAVAPDAWNDWKSYSLMKDKLLNYAGELSDKKKIDGAIFKKTIEGGKVVVDAKYGDIGTEVINAAQWFASNYYPSTTDASGGFNRRWMIWTFNKTVPEEKKILHLGKKIAEEEVEGIVAWALQALPDLLARGSYLECPSSIEARNIMALRNSNLRQWIHEKLDYKPGASVGLREMYSDFWTYCAATMSGKTPPFVNFQSELRQIIQEKTKFETKFDQKGEVLLNFALKSSKKAN